MTTTTHHFHALLVGINQYKSATVPALGGCVNDIDAMGQLLTDRFGVPQANIRRLIDAEATHAAIKAAFKTHLIDAARAWEAAGKPNPSPAFLFHYSGHGSQAPDPTGTEPDGMDETIVPHDSRTHDSPTGEVFDLKDWELGALVAQLTAITDNVTIVLDSCHSGSGTRALDDDVDAVRQCPPDNRLDQPRRPDAAGTRELTGASDWIAKGKHVLIAGCRDRELSREMTVPEAAGDARGGDAGGSRGGGGTRGGGNAGLVPSVRKQGALTYYLIDTLAKMSPDRPLTYRELHARVRQLVNLRYADQTPQCEGDLDREIFGGVRPLRDVLLNVSRVEGDNALVEGGLAHGLAVGTELAVYPPQTRLVADAGQPLATLEVVRAGATRSTCKILPAEGRPAGDMPAGDMPDTVVPEGAKAAITRINYGAMRCRVALTADIEADAAERLAERIASKTAVPDVSGLVEVVALDQAPDIRVARRTDGRLVIQDPAGTPLVAPYDPAKIDLIAADLAHIARYRNGLALRNADSSSGLEGKVTLEVYRLKKDSQGRLLNGPDGEALVEPVPIGPDGELMLTAIPDSPPDAFGGSQLDTAHCDSLNFKITNHHTAPLHVALLNFGVSWGVFVIYPIEGSDEALKPGQSFFVDPTFDPDLMPVTLPPGMPEGHESFKLIVTPAKADFKVLEQEPLKSPFETPDASTKDGASSPLQALLDQAGGGGTRDSRRRRVTATDDWTTVEIRAHTILSLATSSRAVVPGAATLLDYGVTLRAPSGFSGTAQLLTAGQSSRSLGGEGGQRGAGEFGADTSLQPPPGLAAFGSWFQPLPLGSSESRGELETGALAQAGAVIELKGDPSVFRSVTPEAPLTVELPEAVEAGAGLLALGFDGQLYFPVGWQGEGGRSVDVEWLPEPAPPGEATEATRDFKGAIRLYLFKAIGLPTPELGLRRSRFVAAGDVAAQALGPGERAVPVGGGELRYAPVRPGEIKAGQRVGLFVHGFTSDTLWMADGVVRWLASKGVKYDHVLTFDYETAHTGMDANGEALADALRLAGFKDGDGITLDVFAHSMGTQVTRSMIERHGGHAFVDRAFLAGPPNEGTALASLKQPIVWLLTLMLNQAGPTPPAMAASWALKKFSDNIKGMNDLRPDSDFYTELRAPGAQHDVVYRVLIGRNTLRGEAQGAWERAAKRLADDADSLLDFVHQGDNDLAIAISSARALEHLHPRATELARLDIRELPCDHFGYFATPEAQGQLLTWLGVG